jgi:hypothetical protein
MNSNGHINYQHVRRTLGGGLWWTPASIPNNGDGFAGPPSRKNPCRRGGISPSSTVAVDLWLIPVVWFLQKLSRRSNCQLPVEILSRTRVGFADGGYYHRVKHKSSSTGTNMIFGLYLPSRHKNCFVSPPTNHLPQLPQQVGCWIGEIPIDSVPVNLLRHWNRSLHAGQNISLAFSTVYFKRYVNGKREVKMQSWISRGWIFPYDAQKVPVGFGTATTDTYPVAT